MRGAGNGAAGRTGRRLPPRRCPPSSRGSWLGSRAERGRFRGCRCLREPPGEGRGGAGEGRGRGRGGGGVAEGSPDEAGAVLALAGPAFLALAADPVAGLVDTAFLGRLGVDALASSGVALAALALASKVLCTPLTAVSTSALATAAGREAAGAAAPLQGGERAVGSPVRVAARASVQAGGLGGLALALALLVGAPIFVRVVTGAPPDSTPYGALAVDYLRVRALGAPALVASIGALGSCRGLGDVRTPLVATVASNALNVGLDALFIFGMGLGVPGAAAATAAGEWLGLAVLLRGLRGEHGLPLGALLLPGRRGGSTGGVWSAGSPEVSEGEPSVLAALLGRGGLLALRSVGVTGVFTVGSALAARCGVHEAAAHQVMSQVWLGTSLLADALAVAAQALMGQSLAAGDTRTARRVADRVGVYGLALGGALSLALFSAGGLVPGAFTEDPNTLAVAMQILPWVVLTQPLNALAFAGDGVLYGAEDFKFASLTMAVAAVSAMTVMTLSLFTPDSAQKLQIIWAGLGTLMAVRAGLVGFRYLGRRGPFASLDGPKAHAD